MTDYLRILNGPCINKIEDPAITFSFKVDDFQQHSFYCISKDENVLVTAHTGSGKTAVAKYAIAHFNRKGKKIIYTSPIKALSNQKYKEFKESFEEKMGISIGLMTGDNKINPDADCVIMTTEILRNELYDIKDKDGQKYKSDIYFEDNFIDHIGCVIFDEVHYINDKDRGHVWEETIIMLNPNVTLVMLSATIDKAHEFAAWIGNCKKKLINLIPTTHRVIPLEHYIYVDNNLYKILDKDDKFLNENVDIAQKNFNNLDKIRKNKRSDRIYMINESVDYLKKKDLLQAIYFSFSKKNCEKYAKMITTSLVTSEESSKIGNLFKKYLHKYEKDYIHTKQYHTIKELVLKGIGYHHSGLLPILKEIIEILFQEGLVKILFATETFAVGVNMPTRTIVFTELEKYTNEGKRFLHTAEYKQMSGRAGRRGLDNFGYVIILPMYDFPYISDLNKTMLGKVPHIESKFAVNYSFILKIIQSNSNTMDNFVSGSMYNKDHKNLLEQKKLELGKLKNELNKYKFNGKDIKNLEKYYRYDNSSNSSTFGGFTLKLNKKQLKEKQKIMKLISKDVYNNYKKYKILQQNLPILSKDIMDMEQYINNESIKMIKLLNRFGYLNKSNNNHNNDFVESMITKDNITVKGILAGQINDCNPLILTEMLINNFFNDMEPDEIAGLVSIFINDKNNEKSLDNISENIPSIIINKINSINNIIEKYIDAEKDIGLDMHLYDYWDLNYEYIDIGYLWASGSSFNDITESINETLYEGNFIRNILKLNNMISNIISLSHIYGNIEIIPKLEKIEQLLIRDIVNINSLYIN